MIDTIQKQYIPLNQIIGKATYLKITGGNPQVHCNFHSYQWIQEITCEEIDEANNEVRPLILRNHRGVLKT